MEVAQQQKPTREYFENLLKESKKQMELARTNFDRNAGAVALCEYMLQNKIYTEETNGEKKE